MSHLNYNNREQGSILIFAVLMLGSILAISLTLAAIFLPKISIANRASIGSVGAIYAADSGVEWCIYENRGHSAAIPTMSNGASFSISPSSSACANEPLDATVQGNYQGVTRALQVQTQ